MSLGTFNRCCVCVDLRIGSFIIGYLLLISRAIQLIVSCIHLSGLNALMVAYSKHRFLMNQDIGFFKLITSFEVLLVAFELLITIALINGLHKRIQDQVQMFYVGGFVFEVLRLIILSVILFRYAHLMGKMYTASEWTTLSIEILSHFLYLYFLCAIRSYYFLMRKEDSPQKWNVFTNAPVQELSSVKIGWNVNK